MERLQPLLGTTLMIVAHPDDEVIAFGALMQRMCDAIVVFATDGAPRDQYFWKQYGSREAYAEVRRQEARTALAITGGRPIFLADQVGGGIADQELHLYLPAAVRALEDVVMQERPDCLLTLAYEGGHPDHDSACFMSTVLGRRAGLPVWESPLYHRDQAGAGVVQKFPTMNGNEQELNVEGRPLEKKIEMFHTYKSQKLTLDGFRPDVEKFRPIMDYDFTRPPLPWKLNYEVWQWKMTGKEVSAQFENFLRDSADRNVVPR